MGRFDGDGDEGFPGQWGLWEKALERCFSGEPGQRLLREFRNALLALPEKRLITQRLADETGGVCAIGAFALNRRVRAGEDRDAVIASLARKLDVEVANWDEWEAEQRTIEVARGLGLRLTMAVELAYRNDEVWKETPEERYERILAWVESVILVPA